MRRTILPILAFLLIALAILAGVTGQPAAPKPTGARTVPSGGKDAAAIQHTSLGRVQSSSIPQNLSVAARLRDGYFEVPQPGGWKKFYIAGVNLGPGLPGRFATEAPIGVETYLKWFGEITSLGADTVRVYTLLPPAFYRALLEYDSSHPRQPLYLFQEIWFDDPPRSDLFNRDFTAAFVKEIKDVVDAVHGQADIPLRPGHAGGKYAADVSSYVLGWLIGREIEPHVVFITNQNNPTAHSFPGRYLAVFQGNPSEVWLAKMCDQAVSYEVAKFHAERPVAFVNWPPLDPLTHPSAARPHDLYRLLRKPGLSVAPWPDDVGEPEDAVSLDEKHISPRPEYEAGYFALYHVYPYSPDFIFLDPAYQQARDGQGPNTYWGYLVDLKKYFADISIVVGEYGLSTSLGTAHITPAGWNHGGLSEEQQAEGLVRFTGNIRDAGYAGGLVFEWMDEWWKHSWIARDFEKPFQRKVYWHNELDPEQFFGLVKFLPPEPLSYVPVATAEPATKPNHAGFQPGEPPRVLRIEAAHDPSALYLDLCLDPQPQKGIEWFRDRYVIALNTCDAPCGAEQLPVPGNLRLAGGANFVVDLQGDRASRLLIAHSYNPWREMVVGSPPHRKFKIPPDLKIALASDGTFEHAIVETNGLQFASNGARFERINADRSFLRYGNFEPGERDYSSLGQWYYDRPRARLRLRLSWGLLLALDPSQGFVFWGTDKLGKPIGKISHAIQIVLLSYASPDDQEAEVAAQVMAAPGEPLLKGWSLPWPTWTSVQYRPTFKKSYHELRKTFPELTGYGKAEEAARN